MELKSKYSRASSSFDRECNVMADVVNKFYRVDIMSKRRHKDNVEARMVYAKVLHDRGHSYTGIGKSMGKLHCTVMYYVEKMAYFYETEKQIRDRVNQCVDAFMSIMQLMAMDAEESFSSKIEELKIKNARLTFDKNAIERMYFDHRRFKSIVQLLNERVPLGAEDQMENEINKLLNRIQHELKP